MKLQLQNLTKTINGNTIVSNVNLSMESGNVYGLYGYNGCGKTMLMRLISGLIRPSSGTVMFDGKVLGKDLDFPPNTGILIENPAFIGGYSGYKNLCLLAGIQKKVTSDDVSSTLRRVGLDSAGKKKYHKYSLGMKQRLGIASAIMEKPDLIILDEPTNALDSDGVLQAKKIIKEECERGALVIMTCHDKSVLEDLCDIIFKIDQGRIVSQEVK